MSAPCLCQEEALVLLQVCLKIVDICRNARVAEPLQQRATEAEQRVAEAEQRATEAERPAAFWPPAQRGPVASSPTYCAD